MKLSLNCFVLGYPNGFTANVPEKYINDDFTEIKYIDLTVSNFIEIIKNKVKHAVSDPEDPNSMNLWVVDVAKEKLKNISEKDIENKFKGKLMEHINPFRDYFPDGTVPTLRNIHIIIVPAIGKCLPMFYLPFILCELFIDLFFALSSFLDTQNKRIKLEGKVVNWCFVPSIVLSDF